MPPNKSWLDGPSPKDRAKDKIWQGGVALAIGVLITLGTVFALGLVWGWSVILAVAGFFWLVTGLITYYSGYE